MSFKQWFSFAGIRSEIKNVSWLKKKDILKNTATVLAFTAGMALFFYGCDAVIALIMRSLGLS